MVGLLFLKLSGIISITNAECDCSCGTRKIINLSSIRRSLSTSCGCSKRSLKFQPGTKYGYWTVIQNHGVSSICLCVCGIKKNVANNTLLAKTSSSCGCRGKKALIGNTYGNFTVLARQSKGYFKCKCKCGTIRSVTRSNLLRGKHLSCGCIFNDRSLQKRPRIGKTYGSYTVIENDLWITRASGKRSAASKVKCNGCQKTLIKRNDTLGKKGCKICFDRKQIHTIAPRRKITNRQAADLVNATNKNRRSVSLRNRLLLFAMTKAKTYRKKYSSFIKVMTSREVNYLIPSDPNTPCVWPWDDFGNPLSDAELKKAVRKAKREWKKTHSKLPVAEVAKANKATKKQTQTKESKNNVKCRRY